MSVVVRAITEAEIPKFARTDAIGFGESITYADHNKRWIADELDRTACAFDGDELVATSRNYSFELTVPGGAQVRAGGVSAVAVLPTHTRQGILRSMMTRLLEDCVERDEPVAMLTASEGGIYGRFGFGVSTRGASFEIDTREIEFATERPAGRMRLVDIEDARKLEPEAYDRMRRVYPGALSRSEAWWSDQQYDHDLGTRFDAMYEGSDGSLDGYVCYEMKPHWSVSNAAHVVNVIDFVAVTPDATHALWRFLAEIDLVQTVRAFLRVPLDSPLPWLLKSPRGVKVRGVNDFVWTRVLDVPAALGARRYAVEGTLGLEIHDPFRPGGAADGAFTLEGGPDAATVTPGSKADLACDVSVLSTAWLGGVRWSELAAGGRIEERTAGAVARADAMFASAPLPFPFTDF